MLVCTGSVSCHTPWFSHRSNSGRIRETLRTPSCICFNVMKSLCRYHPWIVGVAAGNLPTLAWKECIDKITHAVSLVSVACVISSSFEDAFSIVCSLLEKRGDASYRTSIESAWSALRGEVREFLNKAEGACKQEGLCSGVKGVRAFMELVKNGQMEEDVVGLLSSLFVCSKELPY